MRWPPDRVASAKISATLDKLRADKKRKEEIDALRDRLDRVVDAKRRKKVAVENTSSVITRLLDTLLYEQTQGKPGPNNILINISDDYKGTTQNIANFIAGGFALTPAAQSIVTSYSRLENDNLRREVMTMMDDDNYFDHFKVRMDLDKSNRQRLYTEQKGQVYFMQHHYTNVVGCRAGAYEAMKHHKKPKFEGAFIIDDTYRPTSEAQCHKEMINVFHTMSARRAAGDFTPAIIFTRWNHPKNILMWSPPAKWATYNV